MEGSGHEPRYCLVKPRTVQIFAETIGLESLQQSAAALLSEDVTYRIRELTQVDDQTWCNTCETYCFEGHLSSLVRFLRFFVFVFVWKGSWDSARSEYSSVMFVQPAHPKKKLFRSVFSILQNFKAPHRANYDSKHVWRGRILTSFKEPKRLLFSWVLSLSNMKLNIFSEFSRKLMPKKWSMFGSLIGMEIC